MPSPALRPSQSRALWLGVSLAVLVVSAVVVTATSGDLPPSAVLLSALVAAATLKPRDAAIVGAANVLVAVALASVVGGHPVGASLWYRTGYYVVTAVVAVLLSVIRTRRERAIAQNERIATLHGFTAELFSVQDVEDISHVVRTTGAQMLGANLAVVLVRDDDRLVLRDNAPAGEAFQARGAVRMRPGGLLSFVGPNNVARYFRNRNEFAQHFPEWMQPVTALGGDAVAIVPLVVERNFTGVLALLFPTGRAFDEDERSEIEQVAREVAVAIERAQLREREHAAAVKLQSSLLGPPIMVEGVGHEARYLPAEASLHVCGDWYTLQRLPDGRVGIAVGDVVGQGLDAATVMGQLRSALSAFSERSNGPAETLAYLDGFAQRLPGAMSTSVALARVDIWGRTIEYSLAGHPPPVIVTPDGEISLLEDAVGPPLAVGTEPTSRPVAARPFPPGSMIVMYSDGLIERRRESLDVGLGRLGDSLRRHWALPLPMLTDALIKDLLAGTGHDDDVALIALRSPASNDHLLLVKRPADPAGLRELRSMLRAWLDRVGVRGDDADAILVAAGEATTNAVEHAYGDTNGLVRLEATKRDGEIICTVTDNGNWHHRGEHVARGNGLPIMRALMDDLVVQRREAGTTVILRYRPVSLVAV